MLRVEGGRVTTNCAGVSRRSVLRAGFLATAGLTLADLYEHPTVAALANLITLRLSEHRDTRSISCDGGANVMSELLKELEQEAS